MVLKTHVYVDTSAVVAPLDKRVYGQFIEHLGRCIYGGIWVGEKSSIPNIKGYRLDVLEAVKAIKPPIVRWPGGNFVSQYHWMDGIGPRENRPRKFDLAWGLVEPNEFGTDEYMEWIKLIGAEPFIVVNAGNGTP
ncbi:MAG: alpha-N-arabinofuranosidase, partial [Ignisphaera sp.]